MSRKQLLALTVCLTALAQPVSEAAAATYLYDVDLSRPATFPGFTGPSPDFVQGTITTDCDNCVMLQSDIVDWNLTLGMHGYPSASLLGPLSGNNSSIVAFNPSTDLVATSVGLFFNISALGGELKFSDANGDFVQFGALAPAGIAWQVQTTEVIANWQEVVSNDEIGNADTTPLPAALPLIATGLGALGLLGWRRKRKPAAACKRPIDLP